MKRRLLEILDAMKKHNSSNMAELAFGLSYDVEYDALVLAPSFTPYKLKVDEYADVVTLKEGAYIAGYLVKYQGLNIAWIKTSSSESNLMDHLVVCAELKFRKLIFIGAVGALKPGYDLGDICTPNYSIAGDNAHSYLKEKIDEYIPFERVEPSDKEFVKSIIKMSKENGFEIKEASVFCTPSIACEYIHLDEIRKFNTDLIEMETAVFYMMSDLIEIPSIALLVVSDNSSTGIPLVGRTEEQQIKYNKGKFVDLPSLIFEVAKLK